MAARLVVAVEIWRRAPRVVHVHSSSRAREPADASGPLFAGNACRTAICRTSSPRWVTKSPTELHRCATPRSRQAPRRDPGSLLPESRRWWDRRADWLLVSPCRGSAQPNRDDRSDANRQQRRSDGGTRQPAVPRRRSTVVRLCILQPRGSPNVANPCAWASWPARATALRYFAELADLVPVH